MNAGRVTSSVPAAASTARQRGQARPLALAPGTGQPTLEAELTKQVEIFVAGSFFGTMLKQMRDSPFRSELFGGGRAGSAYDAMYHQVLAERMGRGVGRGLVRSIVRRIMGPGAGGGQRPPATRGATLNLSA